MLLLNSIYIAICVESHKVCNEIDILRIWWNDWSPEICNEVLKNVSNPGQRCTSTVTEKNSHLLPTVLRTRLVLTQLKIW